MSWRLSERRPIKLCRKRLVTVILLPVAVGIVFFAGCPIKTLTGLRCPTCGMSHAMLSLLHGDLEGYCFYNVMALPVLFAVLLELCIARFRRGRALHAVSFGILAVNFVFYLFRIWNV